MPYDAAQIVRRKYIKRRRYITNLKEDEKVFRYFLKLVKTGELPINCSHFQINYGGKIHNRPFSPLYYAIKRSTECIVRNLLERGADACEMPSDPSLSPLWGAVERQDSKIVLMLMERGAHIHCETAFPPALRGGVGAIIRAFIAAGVDINQYWTDVMGGHVPLQVAAHYENFAAVILLIEAGARLDSRETVHSLLAFADRHPDLNHYIRHEPRVIAALQDLPPITPLSDEESA